MLLENGVIHTIYQEKFQRLSLILKKIGQKFDYWHIIKNMLKYLYNDKKEEVIIIVLGVRLVLTQVCNTWEVSSNLTKDFAVLLKFGWRGRIANAIDCNRRGGSNPPDGAYTYKKLWVIGIIAYLLVTKDIK